MKKETSTGDTMASYLDEPENYKALRSEILDLMERVMSVKSDFNEIAGTGIIYERFQEQSTQIKRELTQMIFTLGEIHGYCLADDIVENVHQNKQ